MIDFFRQCFQQYLSTYSEEIAEDENYREFMDLTYEEV